MRRSGVLIVVVAGLVVEGCGGSSGGGTGGAGGLAGHAGAGGKAGGGGAGGAAAGGSAGQGAGGAPADASIDALALCGASNSPSSGVSCNAIEANGPCVTETVGTGAPPAPAGGTVVAGTYDLVASTVYPNTDAGADAAVSVDQGARRQTYVLSSSGSTLTYEAGSVSGTELHRLNGTMVSSGTGLTLTVTCPVDDGGVDVAATLPYTATASSNETRLIIYDTLNFDHLRLDEYLKR
jgi:hypothetical protein